MLAIEKLKQTPDVTEPTEGETRLALHIDHDRQGVSGSPDLARVILDKIEQSAVFVADVTLTGIVSTEKDPSPVKKFINSNVAIELGYALHALTDRALLMVMNEYYGERSALPFDLQTKAGHIIYALSPDADKKQIKAASQKLTSEFVAALEPFIEWRIENARRESPFPEAKALDGLARFRAPGEAIGSRWSLSPAGHISGQSVNLAKGPATWLRLMPTFDPRKTWAAQELSDASHVDVALQPFIFNSLWTLRAEDGIGACSLLTRDAYSIAFAFETGEIWAIDTWILGVDPSRLLVPELERGWTERLPGYAVFLTRLGLRGPYRWIAGVTGVSHRRLAYPPDAGKTRFPDWLGPECLTEQIVTEGSYDVGQSSVSALLPFFELIYQKCAIRRPEYLPPLTDRLIDQIH